MGIFKRQPDASASGEAIRKAGERKIAAARRLSAAMRDVGEALDELDAADRAFWQQWFDDHGDWGHTASRLMRQMRQVLLCDAELNAPRLLPQFREVRQSRARCLTAEDFIRRQVEADLSVVIPKEKAA